MSRRNWERDELLAALWLYCTLPFGRLHSTNDMIVAVANELHRSASAVAMKACNFASLDPKLKQRRIVGLKNSGAATKSLWMEFQSEPTKVATEMQVRAGKLSNVARNEQSDREHDAETLSTIVDGDHPTEKLQIARVRLVQQFFRRAVLASYDERCAITGISCKYLLRASHIVPWSVREACRADPTNGICLNALHDAAFDRGLITLDSHLKVVCSERLRDDLEPSVGANFLLASIGTHAAHPEKFPISDEYLEYHRNNVFVQ